MNFIFSIILSILAVQALGHEKIEIQPKLIGKEVTDPNMPKNNVAFFIQETPNTAICSGALIHFDWLVTAASCVKKIPLANIRYKLGVKLDPDPSDHFSTGKPIKNIYVHPLYVDLTRVNDIALIQIYERVDFQPYIVTRINHDVPNTLVTLRGYGPKDMDDDAPITTALMEASAFLSKIAECRKFDPTIQTNKMCSRRGRICTGDQGGPLVLKGTNELIGIISVSLDVEMYCATGIKPIETFTNLFLYRKWITQVLGTDI